MRPSLRTASLAVALSVSGLAGARAQQPAPARPADPAATLRTDMRKLWEDHVTWTRVFIISAAAGLPDNDAAVNRLMRNQADIGNAIKPFYGEAAGAQLTTLLRTHIAQAGELVTAAKAHDDARVAAARERWNANADSIADFLSTANPRSWPRAIMRTEMRHHLDLTLAEAQARLGGDWDADVRAYDTVHEHILRLADVLSDGIIRQFPERVASRR